MGEKYPDTSIGAKDAPTSTSLAMIVPTFVGAGSTVTGGVLLPAITVTKNPSETLIPSAVAVTVTLVVARSYRGQRQRTCRFHCIDDTFDSVRYGISDSSSVTEVIRKVDRPRTISYVQRRLVWRCPCSTQVRPGWARAYYPPSQ